MYIISIIVEAILINNKLWLHKAVAPSDPSLVGAWQKSAVTVGVKLLAHNGKLLFTLQKSEWQVQVVTSFSSSRVMLQQLSSRVGISTQYLQKSVIQLC